MKKRLLSLLLAGALILSLFPAEIIFAEWQQHNAYRYQVDPQHEYAPDTYNGYAVFNPVLADDTELMKDLFSARYYRKGISANHLFCSYLGDYNRNKTMPVRIHAESAARYRLLPEYQRLDPFDKGDMQLGFIMRCENDLDHWSMKHGWDSKRDSWGAFRLFGTDFSQEARGAAVMSLGFMDEKSRAVYWSPYTSQHMAMFQMADFNPGSNAVSRFLGVGSSGSCPWGDVNFDDVSALLMDTVGPRVRSVAVSQYDNLEDEKSAFSYIGPRTEFGAGEVVYFHVLFDEPVRFADGQPEKDKVLLIKRKSAETMTEMGDPIEATFWRLNTDRNDMVFRFQVPENRTEPFCFAADSLEPWDKQTFLYGKDANGVGKFQDKNPIFDFVSTPAKRNTMLNKSRVESAIVDLAGNPVRKIGIPFFEKAVLDNGTPFIESCDISITRADQDSAVQSKVYTRQGDTVRLTAVFNKRAAMKYVSSSFSFLSPGDMESIQNTGYITHKAVLNILDKNDRPVEAAMVSSVDEPFSARDNRMVTRLTFEYTIQPGDHLDGEQIGIQEIYMKSNGNFQYEDYTYCDHCGNTFAGDTDGHSIRPDSIVLGKQQYLLDNDSPVITNTEKSKAEEKLSFVNTLTVNDGAGSGTLGADGQVTVSTSYRGKPCDQKFRWALKSAQDNPPADTEYVEGNTTNHPFTVPLLGEEMTLYVLLSGTNSVDSVDISFQAKDRTGNRSSEAKTSTPLSRPIDFSGPDVISFSREISLTDGKSQQVQIVAEDPSGIMSFEYQFGDAVREDAWVSLTEGLAIRPDRYTAAIDVPAFQPGQETMTLWVRMQDAQGIQSSVQQFTVDDLPDSASVTVEVDAQPMNLSEARGSYRIDTTFQNNNVAYFYWTYIDAAGQEHPLADYLAEQNLMSVDYNWVAGMVIPDDFDSRHGFPGCDDLVAKLQDELAAACGTGQERYRTMYRPFCGSVLKLGTDQEGTMDQLYGRFALHLTCYQLPVVREYGQIVEGGDVISVSRTFTMNLLGDAAEKSLECSIYGQYDNNGSLSQTVSTSDSVSLNMESDAGCYTAELHISSPLPGVGVSQLLDAERSTVNLMDLWTGEVVEKIPVEAVDTQMLRFPMKPGKAYTLQPEFYTLGGKKAVNISDFYGMYDVLQISDLVPRQSGLTGFTVCGLSPDYNSTREEHPLGDGTVLYSTMALSGEAIPTVVNQDDSLYLNMQIRTETDRTDDVIPYGFVKVWSDYTTRLINDVRFPAGSMHDLVGTRERPFVMCTNTMGYGNLVDQPTGSAATLGGQTLMLPVFYAQGMTDEEVVTTGMDYAGRALPLLDGRNSFYYQIVLSNGSESEVRTFDILVDGTAPQAAVHMQTGTAPDPAGGDGTVKTMKPIIDYVMDNVSKYSEMTITECGYTADGTVLQPNDPAVDTGAAGYNILSQGSGYLFTAPGKYVLTVSDAAGNTVTVEQVMTDADFDGQAPDIQVQVDPAPVNGDVEFTVSVTDNGSADGEIPFTLTFNDAYMAQLGRDEVFPLNKTAETTDVSFPGLVSIERLGEGRYHVVMDACYNPDGAESNLTSLIFQAEDASGNVATKEVPVTVSNEKPAVVRHYYSAADGYTLEFNKTVRLGEQTQQPYTYGRTLSGLSVTENGDYDVEFIDLFAKIHHETIQAELYPIEYAHKMTVSEKKATNQDVIVTFDTAENPGLTVAVTPSDAIEIVKTSDTVTTVTVRENTRLVYTLKVSGLSDLELALPISNIDKTAPTAEVSYIYEAPVLNGKTEGYVKAVLSNLSEPVTVTSDSGTTHLFMKKGTYTFTFEDAAGNQGSVVASVDAEIDKKQLPQDSDAPGYTLRLYSYNEDGYSKIGSFTDKTYQPEELAASHPVRGKLVLEFVPEDVNPVTVTVQESGLPVIIQEHRLFVLENCTFHVDLTDSCGNKTTLEVMVQNVDNEAPTGSARYLQASNGSMRAYLQLTDNLSRPENIQILNREGITTDSTGTYYTFLKNGSTVIRFRDEARNEGSLALQVQFMEEAKPTAELKKWVPSGAAGELQPPTDPTKTDVIAFFTFNKNVKTISLTNADGTPADSTAVTAASNGKTATVRFTRNYPETVLTFTDFSGNQETYNLPAITVIDKEPLTVIRAEKNDSQPRADQVVYTVTLNKPAYLTSSYGQNDVLTETHTITFPANGSYMLSFADQAGNVLSYPVELRGSTGLADVTVPKVTIKAPMTRAEYDAYLAAGEALNPYKTVLSTEAEISADEPVYVRVDNVLIKKLQAGEVLTLPIDRNGVFKVSVIDEAGNCFLTDFEIDCIDREPPVITSRDGGVLTVPVGTSEADFRSKALAGMTAADGRDGDLTQQLTIEKSEGFSLQKAGLYTVVYRAADHLGNEASYTRKVQVTQGQGMLLYVNGQSALEGDVKALPRGVHSAEITTSLDGTVPLKMLFKPGIQTKGTMKNDSVRFSGTLTVSSPGYYTVLVQTQDRESVLLYLYFSF